MSFTVEITANDDSTYTVSGEDEAAEGAEVSAAPGAGAMPPEAGAEPGMEAAAPEAAEPSGGQTVKTVKEALTLALAMLRDQSAASGQAADDDFQSGFGGAKG